MACLTDSDLQSFREKTADFLDPMSNEDMACNFDVCEIPQLCVGAVCTNECDGPQLFKCSASGDYIDIPDMSDETLNLAREECDRNDVTESEPVGGEGGVFLKTIRDDVVAEYLYDQERHRDRRLQELKILLGIVVLVAIFLVLK